MSCRGREQVARCEGGNARKSSKSFVFMSLFFTSFKENVNLFAPPRLMSPKLQDEAVV